MSLSNLRPNAIVQIDGVELNLDLYDTWEIIEDQFGRWYKYRLVTDRMQYYAKALQHSEHGGVRVYNLIGVEQRAEKPTVEIVGGYGGRAKIWHAMKERISVMDSLQVSRGEKPSGTVAATEQSWFDGKEARLTDIRVTSQQRITLTGDVRIHHLELEITFQAGDGALYTAAVTRTKASGEEMEKILGAILDAADFHVVDIKRSAYS